MQPMIKDAAKIVSYATILSSEDNIFYFRRSMAKIEKHFYKKSNRMIMSRAFVLWASSLRRTLVLHYTNQK